MRISEKKRLALVLSGGGIKAAAFHVGVCLALKEKGFNFAGGSPQEMAQKYPKDEMTFKTYVGSSAGAVISTFLAAGYSINDVLESFQLGAGFQDAKKTHSQPGALKPLSYFHLFSLNGGNILGFLPGIFKMKPLITGGLEALIKNGFKINGLFTTGGLERYFRKYVLTENRFESLGPNLYIVATQLNHSRKVVFGNFKETKKVRAIKYANYATISEAIAASAALPPVFAPYGIKDQKGTTLYYFDGEIRDTLSTHVASDHDADLVIASYSIQPYHFTPEIGSLHQYGIPIIINQALYQVVEQKIQSAIAHKQSMSAVLKTIDGYCKEVGIADEHRERLIQIILDKTSFKPNVDYIYIHPKESDHQMFFADHFSLNAKTLAMIVRSGFKAAISTLRKHNI
ncbi:MAG: patatin-like phospholipase family protein [Pseudomonadota bacterium]|nr:patatin-like phospholipase family protein [Pseudomonadota bacterium]